MKLIFLGATQTVTGSKFLVEDGQYSFLVDCGLFQGYKWLRERNWQPQAFAIEKLDAVVLTHAHIDHSGYIPRLYQQGYRGPVYCHHATRDLCGILLPDSGRIQEEDALFYARHKLGKHARPEPLYDGETAERCLELFQPVDFGEQFAVGNSRIHLQSAGHILGAGSAILENSGVRVGFSGDVGRPHDLIMRPPQPLPELDLLLLESTYGDRLHPQVDIPAQLAEIINDTVSNGGVLLIPSFAVGRAQALQHLLVTLIDRGAIPELPIFLDSPMAIDVSDIYCRYADQHRLTPEDCQRMQRGITYTHSVADSKALEDIRYPHIIIAGSGMATGGRILHHMKRLLPNHRTTLLFTGYQAGGTRGALLSGGGLSVKIHGEQVPCKARIEMIEGLSAHADYGELCDWLQQSKMQAETPIQLVHGEPDAADALRFYLKEHTKFHPVVAEYRQVLHL
ncbi:metallo-beta-lactamase family protein [Microbulbifer donghaiensis]|uniref:Metallo-beta-lactamase family protein n=1 Tax=Microbulbifer donghaiensis TaxID=494016 RepID=A0A1M5G1F9_9GAMM|nr:MBL fold metallo-hydrolase [Microbulbifer donghaiensis]SHF97536.1 metallo-beta-lactamase family protein [Microbulbifer donghaiensis]